MRIWWNRISIACFALFQVAQLAGQVSPRTINFGPEQYRAASQNWSVASDLEGNVFIGNSSGLLSYDGEHWHTWPLPGYHRVRAVYVDAQSGRIFGGGYGEFGYWQRSAMGTYEYQSLSQGLEGARTEEEEIWHIERLPQGILFQSFSVIYLFDGKKVTPYPSPFSSGIMFTYGLKEKNLLQVLSSGLASFDPVLGFELLPDTREVLANTTVVGMVDLAEEGVLIATDRRGFFRWNDGQLLPAFSRDMTPLISEQVNKMISLRNGHLAVGTIRGGVYVMDLMGQVLEHVQRGSGLMDNTVLSLSEDARGGLWVGLDQGLAYLDLASSIRRDTDGEGQLGTVYCAAVHNQKLYLGTNHGLFWAPYPLGDPINTGFQLVNGTQGQVWTLQAIQGQLLCGHNSGTFLIEESSSRLISEVTGAWSWLQINQQTWIQGTYTGLVQVRILVDGTIYTQKLPGISGPIRDLAPGPERHVWGTHPYHGLMLMRLNEEADSVISVVTNDVSWQMPTFHRLRLYHAELFGETHVAIRSDSGWRQWDSKLACYQPIHSWGSIPLDPHLQRLMQSEGMVIGVGKRSVILANDSQRSSLPVEGLSEDPALYLLPDGWWLIGLAQGFMMIDPCGQYQPSAGPIRLSSLAIRGVKDTKLHTLPSPKESFEMMASDQGLALSFTSGFSPEPQRYRFRIPGLQPAWSEWSEEASLVLSILPSGSFTLEIERESDGEKTGIRWHKSYPWYQRKWAVGLYIVSAALLLFFGLRWQQTLLERRWRRRQIEQERARHARAIEAKNQQLEKDIEVQNQELAGTTMNLVRKNEILLELKKDLKDLQKEEEGHVRQKLRTVMLQLNSQLSSEKDWEAFEYHFTRVHQGFFQGLKRDYPKLTTGDLRLAAYLRMNLSSKEIAPLLHISLRSVENKRYRLRVKFDLKPEEQLIDVLLKY